MSAEDNKQDVNTADSTDEESTTIEMPLDKSTISTVQQIPLLSIKAGPRDGDQWIARLKQELNALIKVNSNTICIVISDRFLFGDSFLIVVQQLKHCFFCYFYDCQYVLLRNFCCVCHFCIVYSVCSKQ